MMNYEIFKKVVAEKFMDYMPEQYQGMRLRVEPIYKVNKVLDGITLVGSGAERSISPTLYINHMYEHYLETENLQEVLQSAARRMDMAFKEMTEVGDVNLESAKDNIVFQIINTLQNEEMLMNMPHREFQDLTVIYRWVVKVDENGIQSSPIHNDFAKIIGMNEEQLFKAAVENTRRIFPPTIMPITDIVREMYLNDGMPAEDADMMFGEIPEDMMLWVITNQQRLNGASSMLYDECMHNLAEKLGSDLYIIPSSVHEVIAVNSKAKDPEELADMVYEINMGQVSLEDRLSNQIYFYDRRNRKLTIATNSVENIA